MKENQEPLNVSRKEYEDIKRKLIKFEKTNRDYVVLIPCDGNKGWYEMGDNSALIYKYFVCMPEGKTVSMTDDSDSFYARYEIGKIKARGPDTVRARIKQAGMLKSEQVTEDGRVFFKLKERLTEKQLDRIKADELSRQSTINSILKVDVVDPAIYQRLTQTGVRLHRVCVSKLDKLAREFYGRKLLEMTDTLFVAYYKIAEKDQAAKLEDNLRLWEKMWRTAQDMLVTLQTMAEVKVWHRELAVSIGAEVIEIKKSIERQIRREKQRVEKKNATIARREAEAFEEGD